MTQLGPENSGSSPISITDVNRKEMAFYHPLRTHSRLFVTEPIKEVYRQVKRTLLIGGTSQCFTGMPGVGKTCALEVVAELFSIELPQLPVLKHSMYTQKERVGLREGILHFLRSIGHPVEDGTGTAVKFRIENALEERGRHSGMNTVALLVDEAQVMKEEDWNFLKDLHNYLAQHKIVLVSVFMAQSPQFQIAIKQLRTDSRTDLVGRFAMRHSALGQLSTVEDLRDILKNIDEEVWPENGPTWTEFYLPKAWKAGYRLASEAEKFYQEMNNVAPKSHKEGFSFPARMTFVAIRAFLVTMANEDLIEGETSFVAPRDAWSKAIEEAALAAAMADSQNAKDVPQEGIISG